MKRLVSAFLIMAAVMTAASARATDCYTWNAQTGAWQWNQNCGSPPNVTGNITAAAGKSVVFRNTLTVTGNDGATLNIGAGGTVNQFMTGSSLVPGSAYCLGASALALAQADSLSTLPAICIANSATTCLTTGTYQFPFSQGFTPGAPVYVSDSAAGGLTQSIPASGHYLQAIGTATAADTIIIQPIPLTGGLQ